MVVPAIWLDPVVIFDNKSSICLKMNNPVPLHPGRAAAEGLVRITEGGERNEIYSMVKWR